MLGKIFVEKANFPGQGEMLIFTAFQDTLKKDVFFKQLDLKTKGKLTKKIKLHDFKAKEGEMLTWEIDDFYKTIVMVGAGNSKDFNLAKWKNLLAGAFRAASSLKHKSATICYFDVLGKDYFEIGKKLTVSFHLSNYSFDFFKSKPDLKKQDRLAELKFLLYSPLSDKQAELEKGIELGGIISKGIYLTRNLVNQPASHLNPMTMQETALMIEKESKGKIKTEVFNETECKKLGMGAFLGVSQGSDTKPKFIILKTNNSRAKTKICLIGKSVTFDSGGLSLKPADYMDTMKMDMAGGAVVLGVFQILSQINEFNQDLQVFGLLPACENMPSGAALKPGDIVRALNGKTIEVLNTDAEGRLTLADALSYAEKYIKADYMIDVATLTGACAVALGLDIAGVFSNDEKFKKIFEKTATAAGEEFWPLPLYKPYKKRLKSNIADLKNIGGSRYGGAISAALFLAEFVNKSKWIHIDIAGPAFNTEEQHGVIPKGATGWGVETMFGILTEISPKN